MTKEQQGDVLLFPANNDGEIEVEGGIVTMSSGLETAVYLSLFGGNKEDDGSQDTPFQWWGNSDEIPENQYRSETQNILQSLPATSLNLKRVKDASKRDLAWFISASVASSVNVEVSIPQLNRVLIEVRINAGGEPSEFKFFENWKAAIG